MCLRADRFSRGVATIVTADLGKTGDPGRIALPASQSYPALLQRVTSLLTCQASATQGKYVLLKTSKSRLQVARCPPEVGGDGTCLSYGDLLLVNSIEHADWLSQPAALWVCEGCGQAWCAAYHLTRIVRTTDQLLWMRPWFSSQEYHPFSEMQSRQLFDAAILVERADWDATRAVVPSLPDFESFAVMTDHDLLHLWLQDRPAYAIPAEWESFSHHLRINCIASDPLEISKAISILEGHMSDLSQPPAALIGRFEELPDDRRYYNTLYFDLPEGLEFRTCLSIPPYRLVFSGRLCFQPAPTCTDLILTSG